MGKLSSRFSFANVMSVVAVFIALGGVGYAAIKLPKNSVGTRQIKNHAVTPKKVSPATMSLFKGQKGDPGSPGATNIQTVVTHFDQSGPVAYGGTTLCPAGTHLVGGGYDMHSALDVAY